MGTLALVTGLFTLYIRFRLGFTGGNEPLISLIGGGVLVVAGTSMAFLERVVLVEVTNRKIHIVWRLGGHDLHSTKYDVGGADRVVISTLRAVIDGTAILVADSFPVSLLAGGEELIRVIGWTGEWSKGRFNIAFSAYSPAGFFSHSQHVAALLSTALALPLECKLDGTRYPASAVPREWLDPDWVRAELVWRKYGKR